MNRFIVVEGEDDYGYTENVLVDTTTGADIFHDGWCQDAPEDCRLDRGLSDLVDLLNKLAK